MKKIISVKDIPLDEKVYVRKDFLGYRVVEPLKDPETGKFIWKNFLNKRGFIMLFILLLILSFTYLAFQEGISNYREVMKNPCKFCIDCEDILKDNQNPWTNNINILTKENG